MVNVYLELDNKSVCIHHNEQLRFYRGKATNTK